MNFLAHFHLAWPHPEMLLGALDGDFRKGLLAGRVSPGLESGIRLHRSIDAFTDQDRAVASLREAFPRDLRRFAGIAIDLMFDHCLARNWRSYSHYPLQQFSATVYDLLLHKSAELSPPARIMALRLNDNNLLCLYTRWHSIDRALQAAGRRLRRGEALTEAGVRLSPLRDQAEQAFRDFYPRLQQHAAAEKYRLTGTAPLPGTPISPSFEPDSRR